MRRLLFVSALVAGIAAAGAVGPARATNECRGLQFCIRVAGPWVVVPANLGSARPAVDFQQSCPRGYVIGGLDAELTDRAIDVAFGGRLGSPVGPGVTTERSAVFRGTYTGSAPRAPSFRPHLGCLPTAGGGSGPVPYRKPGVFPPGEPTIRRVRTVRLRPGSVRAIATCSPSERLISSWHAIAFYTQQPPNAALVGSVRATRAVHGRRVEVHARSTIAVQAVRAVVQVGAVCGGGS